jgi:nicotinamidase-related amidase
LERPFFAADSREFHHSKAWRRTAHTCVEATVRFAAELGYEVTTVRDATADYSNEEMRAALDVNIPNYASAIVTTNEVVDSISSL